MTSKQPRLAPIAAALALSIGIASVSIAAARNVPQASVGQPAAVAHAAVTSDGDGETNDDGPGGSSFRPR